MDTQVLGLAAEVAPVGDQTGVASLRVLDPAVVELPLQALAPWLALSLVQGPLLELEPWLGPVEPAA